MSTPILLEFGDSGQSSSAIRQWILVLTETTSLTGSLPVSFSKKCFVCTANDTGNACVSLGISASTSTYTAYQITANTTWFQAIFVGY